VLSALAATRVVLQNLSLAAIGQEHVSVVDSLLAPKLERPNALIVLNPETREAAAFAVALGGFFRIVFHACLLNQSRTRFMQDSPTDQSEIRPSRFSPPSGLSRVLE